jgi:DNA-binding NtrC family response regulator
MLSAPRSRARILVVDDEPNVLATTAAILADAYDVVTASGGEAALEALRTRRFDVLCTDYNMPKVNGADLLRTIRGFREPIAGILVTGFQEHGERLARSEEADSFYLLFKPYAPPQLLQLVERAAAAIERRRRIRRAAADSQRLSHEAVADIDRAREDVELKRSAR